MSGIKTKPGEVEVEDFLQQLDAKRQEESDVVIDIMEDITGKPPVMWGASIVGFDKFHYKTKSGQEADWPIIAFSPRKTGMTLYITYEAEQYLPLVEELGGKNSIGKGCIYLHKFGQVNRTKLRALIQRAYDDFVKTLPTAA